MKKYIIPAVDVTALHFENSVLLDSIIISDDTVGDGEQLTNGWNCEDWTTGSDE